MKKKVIAVFGGSFNPPLNSHFWLAEKMINTYPEIEKVIFVPVNKQYQKQDLLDNTYRYEMLNRICSNNTKLEVSSIELESNRQLYTLETLGKIEQQNPDHEIWFAMGTDNLEKLPSWYQPESILNKYIILVLQRGKEDIEELIEKQPLLKKYQAKFKKVANPIMAEYSSTYARKEIEKGNSIRYLVPEEIYQYIQEMKLYQ